MSIRTRLIELDACNEAKEWANQFTTEQEAWNACDRIDWLFWRTLREGQIKEIVQAAQEIADSVAHLNNCYANYANCAAINAAKYANYATSYAINAASYANCAANAAKQRALNMQIARKHLICPKETN